MYYVFLLWCTLKLTVCPIRTKSRTSRYLTTCDSKHYVQSDMSFHLRVTFSRKVQLFSLYRKVKSRRKPLAILEHLVTQHTLPFLLMTSLERASNDVAVQYLCNYERSGRKRFYFKHLLKSFCFFFFFFGCRDFQSFNSAPLNNLSINRMK